MSRSSRLLGAATAALAAVLAAAPGAGAATKEQQAEALFDRGMKLLDQGHAAEACPLLEQSLELDPGIGTEFRLAECWEKVGRTASAWAMFRRVADEAKAAKNPDREKFARQRAEAVEPRLARLTIAVPPEQRDLDGFAVLRDGAPVERASWGKPVPVDPGDHTVTVSAPGKKPWNGKETAREASTTTVTIPRLDEIAAAPIVAAPPAPPPAGRGRLLPAAALGGGGIAAIAVGIGLFAAGSGKYKDAIATSTALRADQKSCIPTAGNYAGDAPCDELHSKAIATDVFKDIGVVLMIAGGAAIVGGAVYLILPPAKPARATSLAVRAAPVLGAGMSGLAITGSF